MRLDTAIIPCGGLGRRLRPFTRWLPKEMLPVGLKPLLYHALDEIADAGLMRAVIVTNPHKPVLEAAARQYPGPLDLEFVPQPVFRGLGDAILQAKDALAGAPFAVLLADHLFAPPAPLLALLEAFRATPAPTVVLRAARGEASGLVGATCAARAEPAGGTAYRVLEIGRKEMVDERPDAFILGGRYAFPGDVFDALDAINRTLPPGAELSDVPLLQRLVQQGALRALVSEARFFDVGVPEGYREAVAAFPARA